MIQPSEKEPASRSSEINSELFGEALALLGLMLAVENEDYRLDSDTGFYNRRALITDLDHMLITKNVFYVVCVKVTNTDSIRRITGSVNADYVAEVSATDSSFPWTITEPVIPTCILFSRWRLTS